MKIPIDIIIEMGMLKFFNKCANCKKKMDMDKYNIQLCRRCRMIVYDDYYSKMQEITFKEGRVRE